MQTHYDDDPNYSRSDSYCPDHRNRRVGNKFDGITLKQWLEEGGHKYITYKKCIKLMKLWIARDIEDDKLHLFPGEPHFKLFWWNYRNQKIEIDKNMFPEVTFENSPQMVEIKLVNE